jgi:hypothetical protein
MPRKDTTLESAGAEFLVLGQLLIRENRPTRCTATSADMTSSPRGQTPGASREFRSKADGRQTRAFFQLETWTNETWWCSSVSTAAVDIRQRLRESRSSLKSRSTADVARTLISDRESGWKRIRFQKSKFEEHGRQWTRINKFLQADENSGTEAGSISMRAATAPRPPARPSRRRAGTDDRKRPSSS